MSGKVKRLNESKRFQVIYKLNQPNPPSRRSIARQYGVSEATIRKARSKREVKRSAFCSDV